MSRQLYERWLIEGSTTLSEFVAEERARMRQARAQRRFAEQVGPLMQQASAEQLAQLTKMQAGTQGSANYLYGNRGGALKGLGQLFGGLIR